MIRTRVEQEDVPVIRTRVEQEDVSVIRTRVEQEDVSVIATRAEGLAALPPTSTCLNDPDTGRAQLAYDLSRCSLTDMQVVVAIQALSTR